jgi:hypothetical protein
MCVVYGAPGLKKNILELDCFGERRIAVWREGEEILDGEKLRGDDIPPLNESVGTGGGAHDPLAALVSDQDFGDGLQGDGTHFVSIPGTAFDSR